MSGFVCTSMFRNPRPIAALLIIAVITVATAGCASPPTSIALDAADGVSSGIMLTRSEQARFEPIAIFTDDREVLTVMLWGPSRCEPVPTSLVRESAEHLTLTFAAPIEDVCGTEVVPWTFNFATPDAVSSRGVSLTLIEMSKEIRLPPGVLTIPIDEFPQ